MLNFLKRKEEKEFIKLEKGLKKHIGKQNKSIMTILNSNPKIEKIVFNILEREGFQKEISCYSEKVIDILNNYFEKENLINEKNKRDFIDYSNKAKSGIEQNVTFLVQKLERCYMIFNRKPDESGKKDIKEHKHTIKKTFYLDDLTKILDDKDMDTRVLNAFFNNLIKHSGVLGQHNTEYLKLFNKLIEHPNFNKNLLKTFMKQQMSVKGDNDYVELRGGDDIDLNRLKEIILKKKILKHHEILGLATLPYISLWETLVKEYFLTPHLVIDFLNHIFKNNKPEDKEKILSFINTKMNYIHKNHEITNLINKYINS